MISCVGLCPPAVLPPPASSVWRQWCGTMTMWHLWQTRHWGPATFHVTCYREIFVTLPSHLSNVISVIWHYDNLRQILLNRMREKSRPHLDNFDIRPDPLIVGFETHYWLWMVIDRQTSSESWWRHKWTVPWLPSTDCSSDTRLSHVTPPTSAPGRGDAPQQHTHGDGGEQFIVLTAGWKEGQEARVHGTRVPDSVTKTRTSHSPSHHTGCTAQLLYLRQTFLS